MLKQLKQDSKFYADGDATGRMRGDGKDAEIRGRYPKRSRIGSPELMGRVKPSLPSRMSRGTSSA
jgi:hypothetical protein